MLRINIWGKNELSSGRRLAWIRRISPVHSWHNVANIKRWIFPHAGDSSSNCSKCWILRWFDDEKYISDDDADDENWVNLTRSKYASDESINDGNDIDGEGFFGRGIKSLGEPNSRKYFICCRLRGGSDDDGSSSFVDTGQLFDSVGVPRVGGELKKKHIINKN